MTDPATVALEAVRPLVDPGPAYASAARLWQGIPGIERAANGRLWATWYSGGAGEGPDNYVLLVTSADDGASWSEPHLVVQPPEKVRAYDPCLWHDPTGRMWWFWAQSRGMFDGRCGVWAVTCRNSGNPCPTWSEPRRLCDGIMMNKPTVLSTGEWLLPAAVWDREWSDGLVGDWAVAVPPEQRRSNVICSNDQGATWERIGGADVPQRTPDEHMLVERRDGSLWMLVRTRHGIGDSVSHDRGKTWSPGRPNILPGPSSRFFLRRLASGRLLLVYHATTDRSHLTAVLSDDDGQTWAGGLLLDARPNVSYPDGIETADGLIYVIYDRERTSDREILLACFRETDITAGGCTSPQARLAQIVDRP